MQANSSLFPDTDIVIFSLSRWDAPISSPAVSLAREFAKSRRVFYIEHPRSFKDRIKEKTGPRVYKDGAVVVTRPPSTYPINFLPEGRAYDFFSALNNRILLRTLSGVLRENNIRRYIFINSFDPFFLREIPAAIGPEKFVYQCMDDLSQVGYTKRHGVRLEEQVIRTADYTLCTSGELTRLKKQISGNVYFYPNAADTTLFEKASSSQFGRPADLNFPGKKIVGFTGSIEYRTDFNLLNAIARYHAEKIIYLIGPVSGSGHTEAGLTELPNVVFAGPRRIDQLPAYLQYFDCAIIPYKKNTLTRSIYPLKINEYLAAGKPVVATNFSEDIYSFRDNAYVSDTDEEFIRAIDRAIAEDGTEKKQQRIHAAASNSWTQRVAEFWEIVSK